jgi:hypothetical protein
VLLTTVRRPSAQELGPQADEAARAEAGARRSGVARRLAILLGRIWKDKTHFDAVPA